MWKTTSAELGALQACVCLAQYGALTGRQIARLTGIRYAFLARCVLSELSRAGIIRGKRGTGGGMWLAKNREELTCMEVLDAVSGSLSTMDPCSVKCECAIRTVFQNAESGARQRLERVTIADLLPLPGSCPLRDEK